MAKRILSEYDKIYEARIAKALNEPIIKDLLTRDAPPDTELTNS